MEKPGRSDLLIFLVWLVLCIFTGGIVLGLAGFEASNGDSGFLVLVNAKKEILFVGVWVCWMIFIVGMFFRAMRDLCDGIEKWLRRERR